VVVSVIVNTTVHGEN